jgi:mannose-6-phosphate isomerase-like protein (cupin superfamily)
MKKTAVLAGALLCVAGAIAHAGQARQGTAQADPKTPVFWSAKDMKELSARMSARVNPQTHNTGQQLIASANVIYRNGDSGSEIHEKFADFIVVQEGEGSIVIGGKVVGGQRTAPDEIRGDSLDGGTRYPIAAGDSIYIPAGMPHQFFVANGKHFFITIVKVPPKE